MAEYAAGRWTVAVAVLACTAMVGGVRGSASAGTHTAAGATANATAYQENPTHDGHIADPSFVPPLSKLWSKDLGGSVYYPLVVGNRIFAEFAPSTGTASVEALDADTGDVIWGPKAVGGYYTYVGITYDDGQVFALNDTGLLTAYNANTGHTNWAKQLPGQYMFTSAPTATGGVVYAGGAGTGGTLYAVDEADGSVNWTQRVMNGDSSSPAVDGSGVYVSYACEQAYSFTVAGALRWHHQTACEGGGGHTDVLHGGLDYIRDSSYAPVALSETDGSIVDSFAGTQPPAFDDNAIVTTSHGSMTTTRLSTGKVLWTKGTTFTVAPLVVNGYVIGGEPNGTISLLDETTGGVAWTGSAGGEIDGSGEGGPTGWVGLAEAHGLLAVPAGTTLTVFAASTEPITRITEGPADGSYVRDSAAFTFSSNSAHPTFTCSFDTEAVGCASPFTLSNLAEGEHTFSVSVDGGHADSRTFIADRTAPHVTMAAQPQFSGGATIPVSWQSTDRSSGVATSDLRVRTVSTAGRRSDWHTVRHKLQGSDTTLRLGASVTTCFSVRARDEVGNKSRWGAPECTAGLIDDRRLTPSNGWYQGSDAADFDGTFSGSRRHGATLRIRHVTGQRVAVQAAVCPDCGVLVASFAGHRRRISLDSQSVTGPRLFELRSLSHSASGTVRLTVRSAHKAVQVDAIGVYSPVT
jgi:outer membrane protein assembly factor BamB